VEQHVYPQTVVSELRIRIMCQSGVTCLSADCCFCELAQNQDNVSEWSDMSIRRLLFLSSESG
jgi:hypothetical protein